MRHVLGDGGRGSIITASPFSYGSAIGVPAVDYVQRQQYELLLYEYKYLVPGTWFDNVWSPYHLQYTKNMICLFLPTAVEPRIRFYTRSIEGSSKMKSQTNGAKRVHF